MGQKTNPISLRLHIDRHFDSCWYPGHYSEYGQYLHTDLNIREYLKSLFKTLGFHTGRIHVQFYPKKLDIHYFFHPDPLKTKRRRTLYHSPSSAFSFKGLSFLRSVREKQKLFSPKPLLTFREALALQRQKTLHFEQKMKIKKKPTSSLLLKEMNLSLEETFKKLMKFSSKMQNYDASREGQKLFVIKGFSSSESFQTLFHKILGCQKGLKKTGHEKFFENSQKITQMFLQKSDQISQTLEGFEGMCRFLSLPQSLRTTEWVTLPILGSDQSFHHGNTSDSTEVQGGSDTSFNLLDSSNGEKIQEVNLDDKKSQEYFDKLTESKTFSEQILQEYSQFFVKSYHPLTSLSSRFQMQKLMFMKGKNLKHIEKMIDQTFGSQTTLLPYKIQSRTRSASFLCQTAIEQFQKNLSFRHIYKGLLKDVQSDPWVQGIRFVCSGRFGGVEMARVESRKYGQTSLHVFSSHIDYAHGHAITNSGLLGVKIWISYRPMAPNTSSWMSQWSQPQESSQKPQK